MRILLDCSCGNRSLYSDDDAGSTLNCTCGNSIKVPEHFELKTLPQKRGPYPAAGIQLIRWPNTYTICMSDKFNLFCYLACCFAVFELIAVAGFQCSFGNMELRHQKLTPQEFHESILNRVYFLAAVLAIALPIVYWRVQRIRRILTTGRIITAKFISSERGSGFSTMRVSWLDGGEKRSYVLSVPDFVVKRIQTQLSVDILVNTDSPLHAILAPHEFMDKG